MAGKAFLRRGREAAGQAIDSVALRRLGQCSFPGLGASRTSDTAAGRTWAIWVGKTSAIAFRQDIPALVNDCLASVLAFLSGIPCGLGWLFGAGWACGGLDASSNVCLSVLGIAVLLWDIDRVLPN